VAGLLNRIAAFLNGTKAAPAEPVPSAPQPGLADPLVTPEDKRLPMHPGREWRSCSL
jgi:hypothetical protein